MTRGLQQEEGERSTTKLLNTRAAAEVRAIGLRALPPLYNEWQCRSMVHGKILLVGDSHTWLSGCGTAYRSQDVDCMPGRNSPMGVEIVAGLLKRRHTKVCFHLATNDWPDPDAQEVALHRVFDLIGKDRKLILVNSFRPGYDVEINAVITAFAAAHPDRCTIVDWHAVATAAHITTVDGAHFNAAGYAKMVTLVKAGIIDAEIPYNAPAAVYPSETFYPGEDKYPSG